MRCYFVGLYNKLGEAGVFFSVGRQVRGCFDKSATAVIKANLFICMQVRQVTRLVVLERLLCFTEVS